MKNNAIMFMMDSVIMESVSTGRCKISPTPFLDSLRNEALWTTNLYSHGPYTDAATRSLYTGRNTLDDLGYFFKLNSSPVTHYKAFKENGYETIGFYYPYYMMGNNVTQYIDKLYYKAGFEFGSEWGGVFDYYYKIRKSRPLNCDELFMLEKRLDLMFEVWISFYDLIISDPAKVEDMADILQNADISKGRETLMSERNKFESDKEAYIEEFLSVGKEHVLSTINDISINDRISRDFLNSVKGRHKDFFSKLQKNNIKANLFRTMPSPKRIYYSLKRFMRTKDRSELIFIENYLGGLFFFKEVYDKWGTDKWQNMPSTRRQLDFVQNTILPNRDKDKPFFLSLNIEEAHNNLSFFTYDIQNDLVVDDEIDVLEDYLNQLGTDFVGNIIYYLGLRYMDFCIERFCNYLKQNNLWDNTTLLFAADHGSSYTFYPVHNERVNNFHDECYHIPLLIRHPGFVSKKVSSFQYSKDILPTLMDMMGLTLSPYFRGRSMLNDCEDRKCVVTEYMGPGCPDIINRPIWFSARDMNYVVAYKVRLCDRFEEGELCEVYDKKKDSKEYFNIAHSIDRSKIQYLIDEIGIRFNELKRDTDSYYKRLRSSADGIPVNFSPSV